MKDTISVVQQDNREKLFVSWQDITQYVNLLAQKIKESKIKFENIYGIPRGGLIVAVMLSHKLNLPVVTSTKYLLIRKSIITDDIEDSGRTIRKFNKYCHKYCLISKLGSQSNCRYAKDCDKNKWVIFPYEEQ